MRWSRSLMLLCLLLSCSSARAEDLLDIYELARQHDPLIQAAQFANLATRESLRQAYSGLLPTLSAGAEYDLTRQEILDSDNPLFQEGTSDFGGYDLSLTLNQPLFRYAAIVSVRQAKDVVARSGLEYFVAEQELVLRVAELYLQALSAQDDLGFARAEQAALQLHYERAQGQQARGLIPVTDLYDAQARLAAAQEREFSAKDAQDDAFEGLREVSDNRVANPAGIKEELPLGPPDPATVEQWIEAGLKQNLALQVQALTVGVASREVDRRQAGHLPTLDLVARGNRQRTGGDLFGKGRDTEILNVGVELRLPLYQGGLVNSQVKEATYLYQRARKEHERLVRSVERTTRS
ncbi:MAG: TolC family protein, partial [Gemmatimonadetes bacterium]|nr:TolC family protein [Gemmatimonadota bacterium]